MRRHDSAVPKHGRGGGNPQPAHQFWTVVLYLGLGLAINVGLLLAVPVSAGFFQLPEWVYMIVFPGQLFLARAGLDNGGVAGIFINVPIYGAVLYALVYLIRSRKRR